MAHDSAIRLLIADDHEVARSGLKGLLAGTEISIVAMAATAQAAIQFALDNDVDVVLMDICMPDGDGLNALGRIKLEKPDLPIVMISAYDNPSSVARAVAMGASGFLSKGCTRDALVQTIRTAFAGESGWSDEELRRVSGAMRTPRVAGNAEVSLTDREHEVLRQMACGLTNKQIAETLHVSYETVKEHIQHILRKIGVTDRTQAAVWAVRKGVV